MERCTHSILTDRTASMFLPVSMLRRSIRRTNKRYQWSFRAILSERNTHGYSYGWGSDFFRRIPVLYTWGWDALSLCRLLCCSLWRWGRERSDNRLGNELRRRYYFSFRQLTRIFVPTKFVAQVTQCHCEPRLRTSMNVFWLTTTFPNHHVETRLRWFGAGQTSGLVAHVTLEFSEIAELSQRDPFQMITDNVIFEIHSKAMATVEATGWTSLIGHLHSETIESSSPQCR